MANELVINHPTGATLYALLFDATGNVWNGSAFAAPGSASWTDYDIAMSEVATATGIYRASMPAAAAGAYGWVVRKQAGASPAVSDVAVGTGRIEWNGTAEIVPGGAAVGTYSYSNTVDDGSGNLIDGAYVELSTNSGFTNIVNATHTNSLGAFAVYSDTAGTHYLRITIGGYEVGTATVTLA